MKVEKHGGNIHKFTHEVYDFSANLNPFGMPEELKMAIIENLDRYESYPDPYSIELKVAISRYHRVPGENICCGNGAADVIFRIAAAFKPKKGLIVAPTFSEYGESLSSVNCPIDYFLLKEEDDYRLSEGLCDTIRTGNYDIMFLCNPNNPTGILIEKEKIIEIATACRDSGTRMILDECFIDFVFEEDKYSIMNRILEFPNVIILKSFTKMFAMAGIRLGYCVCGSVSDREAIENSMQTWSVSTVAAKTGIAAMNLEGFEEKTKVYVEKERAFLIPALRKLGFKVYDSMTNYIFFKSGFSLDEELLKENILIRNCSNYYGLNEGYYRIAVRTAEENQKIVEVLEKICKNK